MLTGIEAGGMVAVGLGLVEIIKGLIKKMGGNKEQAVSRSEIERDIRIENTLKLQELCVEILQGVAETQRMIASDVKELKREVGRKKNG